MYVTDNFVSEGTLALDIDVTEDLEGYLGGGAEADYAEHLIAEICAANRNDTGLDSYQLLVKHTSSEIRDGETTICLIALPMSVLVFERRSVWKAALLDVAIDYGYDVIVVTGMDFEHDCTEWQHSLAVIKAGDNDQLYRKTVDSCGRGLRAVIGGAFTQPEGTWFTTNKKLSMEQVSSVLEHMK